jgi:hypothetical protein
MPKLLDILHHTVYTTRLIPYVIILPTLSGFTFLYFHGYTLITEPRHLCASVNMHCKPDIILIIVHSGLHGHGTFSGLIVFFLFFCFRGISLFLLVVCSSLCFGISFCVFAWRCVQRGLVKRLMIRRAQNTHDTLAYIMYERHRVLAC